MVLTPAVAVEGRRGRRYLQSKEGQRALKERGVVERTNWTLKEDLGLEERLGTSEPWGRVKVGVRVRLELIRYDAGGLFQMRSGSYSEGVKALVIEHGCPPCIRLFRM